MRFFYFVVMMLLGTNGFAEEPEFETPKFGGSVEELTGSVVMPDVVGLERSEVHEALWLKN